MTYGTTYRPTGRPKTTRDYLSLTQFATRVGVSYGALKKYPNLPQPDIRLNGRAGWSEQTVDRWNANRNRRKPR